MLIERILYALCIGDLQYCRPLDMSVTCSVGSKMHGNRTILFFIETGK